MHLARILTALVLLPLTIMLILKAPLSGLLATAGLCTALGWHEITKMAKLSWGIFAAGLFGLGFGLILGLKGKPFFIPTLWSGFFFFLLVSLKNYEPQKTLYTLGFAIAGFTYVVLGFGHLYLLSTLKDGRGWLLFLLACVFGTDTGAFYTGKTLGRHPLAPRVSPKKTWEGAVGGTLLGAGLAGAVSHLFELEKLGVSLLMAFFLSVVGQLGDLFESIFKRGFGVKDSGSLLPGHGGILDRTDALIFAAPFLYWFLIIKGYGH